MGGAEDLAGLSAGLMLPEATGNVSPHMINFNNTEVGGARFSRLVLLVLLRISLNCCYM